MNDRAIEEKLIEAVNKKDWNLVEDVIYELHKNIPPETMVENEGSCFNNDDIGGAQ